MHLDIIAPGMCWYINVFSIALSLPMISFLCFLIDSHTHTIILDADWFKIKNSWLAGANMCNPKPL